MFNLLFMYFFVKHPFINIQLNKHEYTTRIIKHKEKYKCVMNPCTKIIFILKIVVTEKY